MGQLESSYTIVIVTHNMQQAARVSERAAFFCLGELIEYDHTSKIFSNPEQQTDGRLRHRKVRLILWNSARQNLESADDQELPGGSQPYPGG